MVKRKISFFIAGLACLAFAMTLLIWSLVELKGELAARQRASLLQSNLDDFLASIQHADIQFLQLQNEKRTQKDELLFSHVNSARSQLQSIQGRTEANSKASGHLIQIQKMLEQKLEIRRKVLQKTSNSELVRLQHQALIGEDLMSTNSIRMATQAIDESLEAELKSRSEIVERSWSIVIGLLFATLALSIAFLSYAAHLVAREFRLRTKTENELRLARESAITISNLKSQFVATVSHEIRTPLNAIIGMSDILAARVLDGDLNRFAKLIHSSGKSLLRIVNDILDFSKIEANKIQFEMNSVALDELFESAFELYAKSPNVKGLRFYVTYDSECRNEFYLDGSRLSQILHNLISNALKFTLNGFVLIHGSIKSGKDDEYLVCEVKDSGIGISKENMAHLFQPFQQIESWHSSDGTGLGLAISKRLVDAMGGSIEVESQVSKGSTFRFKIPIQREKFQKNMEAWKSSPTIPSGKKILWVDRLPTYSLLEGVDKTYLPLVHWISDLTPDCVERIIQNQNDYKLIVVAREFCDKLHKIHFTTLLDHCSSRVCAVSLSEPKKSEPPGNVNQSLPNGKALKTRSPLQNSTPYSGEKGWILAVEDNATNQILIEAQLRQLGYSVRCANHGEECLQVLSEFKCDLVLMDCRMPVMDGYEASTRIREREKKLGLPKIPILAMTANVSEEDKQKCLMSGMDDILVKPLEIEELRFALERWIPNSVGLIDWGVVSALSGKTNPSVVKRIIESYSHHLSDLLTKIDEENKISKQINSKQYEIWAHRLRSSSLMLGAFSLAEICKTIEASSNDSSQLADSIVEDFRTTILGTLDEFKNQKMY